MLLRLNAHPDYGGCRFLSNANAQLPPDYTVRWARDLATCEISCPPHLLPHHCIQLTYHSVSKVSVLIFYLSIFWTYLKLQVISFEV